MTNILDILYEYSIKDKVFDRDIIKKIIYDILKDNHYENKIICEISKGSPLDFSNKNILAEFDMDSIIYVYYLEIFKSIREKKYLTKYDNNLNSKEIMFKKNILILETIFHEIEHVKQLEYIKDIYDGHIETQIYRYEYDYLYSPFELDEVGFFKYNFELLKRNIAYNRNYILSFMERMANLNSNDIILSMLKDISETLYNNQQKIGADILTEGYKNNLLGPTTKFIHNIGYRKEFIEMGYPKLIANMPFEERLRYGFQITEEEYKKKVKTK